MGEAAMLADHGEHHAMTEVTTLLHLDLHLLVDAAPLFKEAAYRLTALQSKPPTPRVVHRIMGVEAHCGVDVPRVPRVKQALTKLRQVGRRGLLGHRVLLQAEV